MKTPFVGNNPQIIQQLTSAKARSAACASGSPYVCRPVYDVGNGGGVYFISMAFIDGQPLGRLIAEGQLKDYRAIVEMSQKIARGLHKARTNRASCIAILKPDNIMIDGEGEPIVMDFGLARRGRRGRSTDGGRQAVRHARLHVAGTGGRRPEQARASDGYLQPRRDPLSYSRGPVAVPGVTHFTAPPDWRRRTPRPSSLVPEIGEGSPLELVCLKMMAKSTADRYPSTADVVAALDDVFPRAGPVVVQPSVFRRLWSWSFGRFSAAPRTGENPPK